MNDYYPTINPLCLSFYAPPLVRPQSILIGKMIPAWLDAGLRPVIVSLTSCGEWPINLPHYKIPDFKINKYLYHVPFLRNVLEKFYLIKLMSIAGQIIKQHDLNLIFSFANPPISNILGAMLKEKYHLKFVSHFSDPWFDSPYKSFTPREAKRVARLEHYIIKNSDKVIFITEAAKKLVMKKYPSEWQKKAEVIPHCFDPKDYPSKIAKDSQKIIISHIGAFYQERNPHMLFAGLKAAIKLNPGLAQKIEVRLIGGASNYTGFQLDDLTKMIKDYEIAELIKIIPPVSYEESLRQMKLSDLLVVIDADIKDSPFLTSKVVDYAGSLTAIIGITPAGSPTDKMLTKLGHYSFNYNQLDQLTACLIKLITKQIKTQINQEYLAEYDVKNTTKKLIGYFGEVLKK